MKDNELHSIWKGNIESQIHSFSQDELNSMLLSKAKSKIHSFYSIKSNLIVLGVVIIFLAKITVDHLGDTLLIINNLVLLLSGVWGFGLGIYSYNRIMNYDTGQSLKSWLEYRINSLKKASQYLYSYYFTFPFFILLANIAVSAFWDNLSFIEVISASGFISKSIANIVVCIIAAHFLRKYMLKKYTGVINNLENIYNQIEE